MPDDGAIWGLLADRAARLGDRSDDALPGRQFGRESQVRLLTAAIGVLAATRELVDVAEDVLRQRRDRLAEEPDDGPTEPRHQDPPGRRRIDLTY